MKIGITLIDPPGWDHAPVFAEMIELLACGFQRLGHTVAAVHNQLPPATLNIVLAGFHLEPSILDHLPPRTVFYNLEQVDEHLFARLPTLKPIFARFEIWDFSLRNIERLRAYAPIMYHLPIGTVPSLTRISPAGVQDIDVLFYGTLTARRKAALAAIEAAGLKVHAAFGLYGVRRDALIARSKLVLNMHKHAAQVFEIVRVSYLLANRKAVVTELTPNTEIEPDLVGAVRGAPLDRLAETCRELVRDDAARHALEDEGFVRMQARSEVAYIRRLLDDRQKRGHTNAHRSARQIAPPPGAASRGTSRSGAKMGGTRSR